MNYHDGVKRFYEKLGTHQIMALAASSEDRITVRNISAIIYDEKIYFKTDKNFEKTRIMLENPNVALCVGGVQVEGKAINKGLVVDEPGRKFEKLYKKYWETSYNAYPHEESEILVEVEPSFVEIWDQDENDHGFQIFIDFNKKSVEYKKYD